MRRRKTLPLAGVALSDEGPFYMEPARPAARLSAHDDNNGNGRLPRGDVAILKFLAAAEIIESDLWQQYNELGGANGGNPNYIQALVNLDGDMPQYISDNTDDEISHAFPQAVNIVNQPAIPLDDTDTPPSGPLTAKQQARIQAIANAPSFHFAFIEQGGSSLYSTLALQVTNLEVLRIVISIGGVEVDHFSLWHDKAGNAVSKPLAPLTDPETGVTFPVLPQTEDVQPNLILPEPCAFLRTNLPVCSVIRPTSSKNGGAVATVAAFSSDLLFQGQPQSFFEALMDLATAADAAQRGGD